jgi:hypothetical protein
VFLENELADFAESHADEDSLVRILRKTWRKMSDRGRGLAPGFADRLPARARELLTRAVSERVD